MTSHSSTSGVAAHENSEEEQASNVDGEITDRESWEDPIRESALAGPDSARTGEWQTFREVRWKVLRQAPTWPKLNHKQLETFDHTRQMMWIFRTVTMYCHWCNQATADVFGSELFDNFDWGPYCSNGLQGETKEYLDVTLLCFAKAEQEGRKVILVGPRRRLLPGLDHKHRGNQLTQLCIQPLELVGIGKCGMLQIEGEVDLANDHQRSSISDLNSPVENALGLLEDLLNNILPGRQEVETVRNQLLTTSDLRTPVHADRWLAKRPDLSPQARAMLFSMTGLNASSSSSYGPLRLQGPAASHSSTSFAPAPAAAAPSDSPQQRHQRHMHSSQHRRSSAESSPELINPDLLRPHHDDGSTAGAGWAHAPDSSSNRNSSAASTSCSIDECPPDDDQDQGAFSSGRAENGRASCEAGQPESRKQNRRRGGFDFGQQQSKKHLKPDKAVIALLKEARSSWGFDMRGLQQATDGRVLSALALDLFQEMGLVESLGLQLDKLTSFLEQMDRGYILNPYHNATHTACVLQSLHMMLTHGGVLPMFEEASQPLILLTCYIGAIVHDFGHIGVNNNFLITSMDELALIHNDQSPHENHHLAASFKLLFNPRYNFMGSLPNEVVRHIRKLVISMVLKTDMSLHFATISNFKSLLRSCRFMQDGRIAPDAVEYVLQMLLKAADLSHTTAATDRHIFWTACLEEEMFRQGDRERAEGMAVSPLMDRESPGMSTSQVGFFELVVIPLYEGLTYAFEDLVLMLHAAKDNHRFWVECNLEAIGHHMAQFRGAIPPSHPWAP
ncbi:hypothetical protein WJX74_002907 [Apatococcus lobatus]|uniref:Phosphodiesterase n=1 Tax=Apatococcus lobatus TaxID=904363 RepID=A0AAW1QB31_9CHLO